MGTNIVRMCLLATVLIGQLPFTVYAEEDTSVTAEHLEERSREIQRLQNEIEEARKHYENSPKTIYLGDTIF